MKRVLAAVALAAVVATPQSASADRWTVVHEPPGDPDNWTWAGGDAAHTSRWDPCATITWSTPHDGSELDRAMSAGIRQVARFTRYSFQRVETGAVLTAAMVPNDNPTLVAIFGTAYTNVWGTPRTDGNMWADRVELGFAVWLVDSANPERGHLPELVLHELGHAVGLGHARGYQQVMAPSPGRRRYGAGDRGGLAAVRPDTCAPASPAARGSGLRVFG